MNHILVNDLSNDTFYARIVLDVNGESREIDSRPSDAIALAVRAKVPIFADEQVLDKAGVMLDKDGETVDRRTRRAESTRPRWRRCPRSRTSSRASTSTTSTSARASLRRASGFATYSALRPPLSVLAAQRVSAGLDVAFVGCCVDIEQRPYFARWRSCGRLWRKNSR